MRRGDGEGAVRFAGRSLAGKILRHGLAQGFRIVRVSRAGVGGGPHRPLRELAAALVAHPVEPFVFQKAGRAERLDQVPFHLADLQAAGEPHQRRAQVQVGLGPVEAGERLHQRGRNDQHGIGEAEWVADEQPGVLRRWGGHEIEIQAKARKRLGQILS